MCLPVSRLFWVSSLAYPNLLGTKGYVVVVVVVVVVEMLQLNECTKAHAFSKCARVPDFVRVWSFKILS
jgi:hypothetical protein